MTALPDPTRFASTTLALQEYPLPARPSITESFWGYEVARSEYVIDLAVLARGVAALVAVGAGIGTVLVWFIPAMAFGGDAFFCKYIVAVSLLMCACVFGRFAMQGARIRVQVDTARGELREVVESVFGSVKVLSTFGFDAVTSVEIVASRAEPSFGQIQVMLKDGGPVVLGDGPVMALRPLQARLAGDCGLEGVRRDTVWGGALSA